MLSFETSTRGAIFSCQYTSTCIFVAIYVAFALRQLLNFLTPESRQPVQLCAFHSRHITRLSAAARLLCCSDLIGNRMECLGNLRNHSNW